MTRNETPSDAAPPARQRIAKLMARVGLCSRRDAEAWVVDGRVSVNGELLTSPAFDVGPEDAILVDGVPLPAAEKTRLFLFHKPRGLVTSDHDPEGRATVADYLREHWPDGPRVVTIGRLDINTEGLLLLTNDGGLARLLELPKTGWVRRYRVRAKGETDQGVLDGLRNGVSIEGIDYAGIEAVLDRSQGANLWLTMGLREGKNREVKRLLEHIGLEVNRLIRLSFGPFQLGELPEGAVEEVRTRVLRDQLGTALAAAAGVAFEDAPPPADPKPARGPRAETAGAGLRARPPARGDRPLRRKPEASRREPEAPPHIRERPVAGTRKHVSALRAAEADKARHGPRRRVERSDVTDRRDRTVQVERLVGARPAALEPTRPRDGTRPPRRDRPDARSAPPGRRTASPSALAKRARSAKSGAREELRPEERRDTARAPRQVRAADGQTPRQRTSPARSARDDAPRQARPEGAPKRFETSRGDSGERRGPPRPRTGPSERPRNGERREPRRDGAPKRFESDRAASGRGSRPPRTVAGAAKRPRDGERREARPDGAARRLEDKRADAGGSRRATREVDGKRFGKRRFDPADGRETRGGPRSETGEARGTPRPQRGGASGKPRGGSAGPRKPGGDRRPPAGPSRGKPSSPRPKR